MAQFGRMSIRARKNVSIGGVVVGLITALLGLYVGGSILNQIGASMLGTQSVFYGGLSLIGWTVGGYPLRNASHYAAECANTTFGGTTQTGADCISSITSSTGSLLTVIGIIAIAAIVMQFVEVKFR